MDELNPSDDPGGMSYDQAEAILRRLGGVSSPARETPSASPPAGAPPAVRPAGPVGPISPLTADALRSLVEAVPDALVVVDGTGRIVLVNQQTERLFGYGRDELLGFPVEVLLPDRFRGRHVGQRDGYFAAPHVRPMGKGLELVGRRKDGHEVPVEISLSPLRTDAGVLAVSTIRDVTERRKAEGQLRKTEARYRTLVEGIPAVTFMAAMDESANELYVSPQIEELLGFSQKEWLENPILWYTQLHPDDRVRWHKEFAHTCSTGERFRSVYRFVSRDGRVVWVHGEAQVVKDDDGQPLFLQGVAFDVTGIKQAEEGLKALNATLDERVARRTAEAEHRSRELERSNVALKEFAGVAAHDLGEPLRTMKSKIKQIDEILVKQNPGPVVPTVEKAIASGLKASSRMEMLIEGLFAFSKVQTDGMEPVHVACGEALAAACDSLEVRIAETGGEVVAGELPTVRADFSQLTQLFQNLISNSLKFRVEGRPPRIHVSARRQGREWVIEVTDNGIGIDGPKALAKIFKLGVESRQHSRDKFPGSGIGLTTCERIVERHGGRIWAASDGPDRGTMIAFTLPAAD